jgi:hypothetical protein
VVEGQSQEQTDDDAETDAGDRVVEGVAHRLPEERVIEKEGAVVVNADPFRLRREAVVGKAERKGGH